ncbi:transcriptional regulator of yeast form adherence 4-like isoform X1 [Anopheles stephensi]|uniref:transcriptional regulator of yeast form adherence 4-like isoform X1 n=2 Tax=Anopheles stephensi TaxID=30069 RepID=UPI0016589597|nr:transcriptional regulator of yeast form adherence 4-like isoform X1 [Anopheles stephensi]XP_035907218.1 transcriptional regulator of yeast form adherence 4-like isoform X1 [Anopheles stephensi]
MSETQFVCDLCGQRYSTFEILMTHNRLKHYHTIKFGCGYCNETFRHEDDLYCHFVLTHRVDPYAKSRCNSSESEAESEVYGSPGDTLIRQAEETCGQMRLISESDDGSESIGSCSGESSGDEEDGSDLELNYNELYMRRKRSAMTQEEISELTDVFKKSVQSTYSTKLRL